MGKIPLGQYDRKNEEKKQEKKIIIHHQTDDLNEKKNTWMRQSQIAAAILHAPQSDGLVLGPRCQNDAIT